MVDLPSVRGREVVGVLEKAGWTQDRSSNELVFVKEGVRNVVRVPNHPSKDMKIGTLRAIIRDAGLTREEFVRLLKS